MLPLNPTQIKRLFTDAVELHRTGALDAAEAKYRQVLAAKPGAPEVLFQLGRIALMRGRPGEAAALFEKARHRKPGEAAIWHHEAKALARLRNPARTRDFLRQAKAARLDPGLLVSLQDALKPGAKARKAPIGSAPPKAVDAAIALLRGGQAAEAEARAAALHRTHPDSAVVLNVLASAQAAQGKREEAVQTFAAGHALAPDYPELQGPYGRLLVELGRPEEAVRHLRDAYRAMPGKAQTLIDLALGLARIDERAEAEKLLYEAIERFPERAESYPRLARLLMTRSAHAEAERVLERARAAGHETGPVLVRLAEAQARQGKTDAARASHDAAIAADPELPLAYSLRGIFLQTLGEFDAAEADFRKAIELEPRNGEHYRSFLATYKIAPDDPLVARMETLFDEPDLRAHSRMHLGFALSRAMEQIGAHDRVFTYLRPANRLMRERYPYDIAERRAEVDAIKAAFSGTDFTARQVADTTDYAPIFVTGMPRSGTTLVEQIIASHSRVTGGGEIGFVVTKALEMISDHRVGDRPLGQVPDAEIAALGHTIEAEFRARFPGSDLVTDKSIQTFMIAGLVRLALPNARFVLVHRDPRDVGLSIYKNMFSEGTHRYAYDLRDLGLYYRMFLEMVEFWRTRLPGAIHEIRYEDLIADPEGQARALIAGCGLDWQDGCLDFHKTERRVSTLSLHQVRQPIYASSAAAWKRHEDDLAELIEALGDAIEEREEK